MTDALLNRSRRHDLSRVLRRPAGPEHSVARARRAGASSIASSTCATSPTTAIARSTTIRTAAAPGMVMKPEPFFEAVESLGARRRRSCSCRRAADTSRRPTRSGTPAGAELTILCGHYKDVDQRVADHLATEEISLGDFVLSGGEPAALAVIDATVRLLPGRDVRPRQRARRLVLRPADLARRATRGRPRIAGTPCPTSCCPATTSGSTPGDTPRASGSRATAAIGSPLARERERRRRSRETSFTGSGAAASEAPANKVLIPALSRSSLIAMAVVVLATFIAFAPALRAPFAFDDIGSIPDNPTIEHVFPLSTSLSPPPRLAVSGRPAANLSLAVDHAVSASLGLVRDGDSASDSATLVYHVTNVLLHVVCGLLLFGVVRRTLSLATFGEWGGSTTALRRSRLSRWASGCCTRFRPTPSTTSFSEPSCSSRRAISPRYTHRSGRGTRRPPGGGARG